MRRLGLAELTKPSPALNPTGVQKYAAKSGPISEKIRISSEGVAPGSESGRFVEAGSNHCSPNVCFKVICGSRPLIVILRIKRRCHLRRVRRSFRQEQPEGMTGFKDATDPRPPPRPRRSRWQNVVNPRVMRTDEATSAPATLSAGLRITFFGLNPGATSTVRAPPVLAMWHLTRQARAQRVTRTCKTRRPRRGASGRRQSPSQSRSARWSLTVSRFWVSCNSGGTRTETLASLQKKVVYKKGRKTGGGGGNVSERTYIYIYMRSGRNTLLGPSTFLNVIVFGGDLIVYSVFELWQIRLENRNFVVQV